MPLVKKSLHILIVEDNEGDYFLFEEYLQQTNLNVGTLHHARSLAAVDDTDKEIDIAFLDLSLPDSGGVNSFSSLNQKFPNIPIVVLSGLADEKVALDCIAMGAQDYLLKDELSERMLEKSVFYSIERKKNLVEMLNINKQYELIGSVTNDVIWNWNLETHEVTCPKKSFLGYRKEEIEKGIDWWIKRIHPEDEPRFFEAVNNVLENKSNQIQIEYRFLSGNGEYQHLFSRGVLLATNEHEPRQMIGALMDITETKKLEEQLLQSKLNMQRQMTEAMIQGQEKQKEEIGKELHDNINQILASVKLYIDVAMENEEKRTEMLSHSRHNVLNAINEVRKLSHSLVPPSLGDVGLTHALEEFAEDLNLIGLFQIYLQIHAFEEGLVSMQKKLVLFRIVQEQMNNVIKYAKAEKVWITLARTRRSILLSIRDNGEGFDMEQKPRGIGLRNIESRVALFNGSMHLQSAPGQGTTLEVIVPIE